MTLHAYDDLDPMQIDVLREIGNIGSGNAATSLADMLGRTVDIKVPKVSILDYSEVVEGLGGPEVLQVGLMFTMCGDVTGMLMFLLNKEFAHMVLNTLTGGALADNGQVDEMDSSAIREVGNIMAASYVNAMASLTGLMIDISVPDMCIDMAGSILSVPAIYYANISEKIIFIEDEFGDSQDNSASHILMIPEVDALNKIMTNLGLDI